MKTEEGADINGHANKDGKRNLPTQGLASSAVEDQTDVLEAEEPTRRGAAGTIHCKVGEALGSLVAAFHGVLVLTVRLTGPLTNTQGTKDVQNAGAADQDGMVTEEPVGGASFTDDILKSVDKLFVCLHPKSIHNM